MSYIFLHGLGQNPSAWGLTISRLKTVKDVQCPSAVDLLAGGDPSYERLYKAFCAYCDAFDGKLNICGLSLGAMLALHYGITHPDRVSSLVLIAAQDKPPKAIMALQNVLFWFMPDSMFSSMGLKKAEFIRLTQAVAELDLRGDLGSVQCPVLVLCGDKDKINQKAAGRLAKELPHSEHKLLHCCGHEANIDAPEELADVLNAFWSKFPL